MDEVVGLTERKTRKVRRKMVITQFSYPIHLQPSMQYDKVEDNGWFFEALHSLLLVRAVFCLFSFQHLLYCCPHKLRLFCSLLLALSGYHESKSLSSRGSDMTPAEPICKPERLAKQVPIKHRSSQRDHP